MSKRRHINQTSSPTPGRREVLGAMLAGAALLGCGKRHDPTRINKPPLRQARGVRPGEERWVLSTCTLCEAGCGIKVRVVEGRAVKIEGNPEHPVNHGGLCSRGQAGLQLLYAPDRVRSPLRRVGARGAGQWQPLSWEEAIAELADKLSALRAAGHPERVVMLDGQAAGFVPELWARLLSAYGSRNHVALPSPTLAGADLAARYARDREPGLPAYDVDHARLVVLFGSEGMGFSGQALRLWQAASAPVEHGRGRRLRVMCVSPRRPEARVDEWIPILPGGHGALALSLAHVLLRDRLIDRDFVDKHLVDRLSGHVLGASAALEERLKKSGLAWVQAEFSPEQTAAVTGIAPATVERLAHELAKQQPALLLGSADAAASSNGLATAMAVLMVNVLLGNWGQEGGMLWQQRARLADWPGQVSDKIADQGLSNPRIDGAGSEAHRLARHRVHALPEAINQGQPYPVEILLVRKADPLATLPARQAWTSALHKLPLLVSFSSRLDRTAMLADLILPESTPLETWDVLEPVPTGEPLLGMCQPVVEPVHDTRSAGDLVIELAQKLGGSMREAVPWSRYQDAISARLQGVAQAENDEHVGTLLASMKDKGGWWPEDDDEDKPAAEPGKLHWASLGIFMRMQKPGPYGRVSQLSSTWPVEGLPPWEPARFAGAASEFPLLLWVDRPASLLAEGACAWLQELPLGTSHKARIEMHPETAARLGLVESEAVTVESPAGTCAACVHVSDGIRPDVVAMALGKDDVLDLLVVDEDRWAGLLAWQGTRVRVRKIS